MSWMGEGLLVVIVSQGKIQLKGDIANRQQEKTPAPPLMAHLCMSGTHTCIVHSCLYTHGGQSSPFPAASWLPCHPAQLSAKSWSPTLSRILVFTHWPMVFVTEINRTVVQFAQSPLASIAHWLAPSPNRVKPSFMSAWPHKTLIPGRFTGSLVSF